jgi:phosphoglycolate phosphatase-like HAD superfamily hydrolase
LWLLPYPENKPVLAAREVRLRPDLAALSPALIIFDKDGTLIDFHAMWGRWATELARRLASETGLDLAKRLFQVMDFDPLSGHIRPEGNLAVTPLAGLRAVTVGVLYEFGLAPADAELALLKAWHEPDPVALARPFTDLTVLFTTLQHAGCKIAIATSDDRRPTEALLDTWQLSHLVDGLACADDGLPLKPAPDMVLALCDRLTIPPPKTIVVGDNVPDLEMGRRAGAGLIIGVLSGVGAAADLAPRADLLLNSVGELV